MEYQRNTTSCFTVSEVNSVSDQLPPGWSKGDMALTTIVRVIVRCVSHRGRVTLGSAAHENRA